MPELPEVETVRRGLAPAMEGARFEVVTLNRPDLRFPLPEDFSGRLTGRRVTALSRRAKYLLADLDDGAVLIMHLGMSGSFRIEETGRSGDAGGETTPGVFQRERSKNPAHDHVVFDLSGGRRVTYNDPRRFGFMTLAARAGLAEHPLMRGIGLEPLGNALTGAVIADLFRGKAAPLKAALLDQRLIAGLGNIYVCEALWRAGLAPTRAAGDLSAAEADRLADDIRAVLGEAIEAGGSSLRDFVDADGALGYFQHRFKVYGRAGAACERCGAPIDRLVQSGRSTFHCAGCQH